MLVIQLRTPPPQLRPLPARTRASITAPPRAVLVSTSSSASTDLISPSLQLPPRRTSAPATPPPPPVGDFVPPPSPDDEPPTDSGGGSPRGQDGSKVGRHGNADTVFFPQVPIPIDRCVLAAEMSNDNSLLEYSKIVMKMFNSEDEGFEFYNDYAYEKGFSVRKDYCEWDNGHNERTLRKFVCSSEGLRTEKHLRREIKMRRPRNITRFGCHAKLVIAQDHNTKQWYVKDFIDEHNHPMIEPDLSCFLRSHRRISDE